MADDLDLGWDDIQLLRDFFADDLQFMPFRAVALFFRQIVDDFDAR